MNFSGAAKPFRKIENIPAKDLEVHHWFCKQRTQYSCFLIIVCHWYDESTMYKYYWLQQ